MTKQDHFSRRRFIGTSIAATAAMASSGRACPEASPDQIQNLDVKVIRVMSIPVKYQRPRTVAGNSHYRVAGNQFSDPMLIVFGDNGKIGVGWCRRGADLEKANYLIGKRLSSLLLDESCEVNRRTGTSALWDLAGKTLECPVYKLLVGKMPQQGVPVYDGSIYQEELLSRDEGSAYRNAGSKLSKHPDWKDVIKEAIDLSLAGGHNFVKVKIGRGRMHMSREAGNIQDAAVLRLIREHAGDTLQIGVDANDGYRLEDTIWLLKEHGDLKLDFLEEMFRDDPEPYLKVREVIKQLGLSTKIADGETWKSLEDDLAVKMIHSNTLDILQADMRNFEIEGILALSKMAEKAGFGSQLSPHNWSTWIGTCMMMHVACAIPNFYRGEVDPARPLDDVLVHQGYKIKDGMCTDFDAPGFGITVNIDKLAKMKPVFDVGHT